MLAPDRDAGAERNMAITAVFLFKSAPPKILVEAVRKFNASKRWNVVMEKVDTRKAEAFRISRVPAMLLYNHDGMETARVIGESNIVSTIEKLGVEDA